MLINLANMVTAETKYRVTQNLLRKFIKKKYGDLIKIRVNAIRFIRNREFNYDPINFDIHYKYSELISVLSKTELTEDQKKEIKDFLLIKINQIQLAITGNLKVEIECVGLTFVSPT